MRVLHFAFRLGTVALLILGVSAGLTETLSAKATPVVAVGSQYDTTLVYDAPENLDTFVMAFQGTFGGTSTKQVVVTVTPTPSSTSSQLLQTPVGTGSLFGFQIPIPYLSERKELAILSPISIELSSPQSLRGLMSSWRRSLIRLEAMQSVS